jgi:hypothetical protein
MAGLHCAGDRTVIGDLLAGAPCVAERVRDGNPS